MNRIAKQTLGCILNLRQKIPYLQIVSIGHKIWGKCIVHLLGKIFGKHTLTLPVPFISENYLKIKINLKNAPQRSVKIKYKFLKCTGQEGLVFIFLKKKNNFIKIEIGFRPVGGQ